MSCIQKLLSIKGENEFLKLSSNTNGNVLLSGGKFLGYDFCVTINPIGHRCGYVAIKNNHPYFDLPDDIDDLFVHGGVTFFDSPKKIANFDFLNIKHNCNDKWVGFDTGHFMDAPDFDLIKKIWFDCEEKIKSIEYFNDNFNELYCDGEIRDTNYVTSNCIFLINQLKEAEFKKND